MENILNSFNNIEMNNVINFIIQPEFKGFLLYIKIIFIAVSAILFGAIIILLKKSSWLQSRYLEEITEFTTYRPFGIKESLMQWNRISKRLETGEESEYRLAVIEAETLLDKALAKLGYKGDNFIQKLEQLDKTILPNIKDVYKAHEIRNSIVHNPDYKLTLDKTKEVLAIYERAARDSEIF
jgi:hypothetical protein